MKSATPDRQFVWGVIFVVLGLSLLPVGWYFANDRRLLQTAFPWALRAAVLAHIVGAAFILSSARPMWLRLTLAALSIAGVLVWYLAAFTMI